MQYPLLPRAPTAAADTSAGLASFARATSLASPASPTRSGDLKPWLPWDFASTFQGRLSEISCAPAGSGQLTLAMALVLAGQRAKEPVAWLQAEAGDFFPPDAAAHGVDLAALALVRVGSCQQPNDRIRAAEILLQAGGFGLVVVDLTDGALPSGWGWQGRLLALARQHHAAVVLLTATADEAPSLGAWVALRLVPCAVASTDLRALFDFRAEVAKNKVGLPFGPWQLQRRGPDGLW